MGYFKSEILTTLHTPLEDGIVMIYDALCKYKDLFRMDEENNCITTIDGNYTILIKQSGSYVQMTIANSRSNYTHSKYIAGAMDRDEGKAFAHNIRIDYVEGIDCIYINVRCADNSSVYGNSHIIISKHNDTTVMITDDALVYPEEHFSISNNIAPDLNNFYSVVPMPSFKDQTPISNVYKCLTATAVFNNCVINVNGDLCCLLNFNAGSSSSAGYAIKVKKTEE